MDLVVRLLDPPLTAYSGTARCGTKARRWLTYKLSDVSCARCKALVREDARQLPLIRRIQLALARDGAAALQEGTLK